MVDSPALVVETGAVVADANSWVDMNFMDQYCADMGYTDWPTTAASPDDLRIAAVIRGQTYVTRTFADKWPGLKTGGRSQSLPWPRTGAVDAEGQDIAGNEIPIEVKQAQCEAARREYVSPGSLTPDYTTASRVIREKVGDLEVQYADDFSTGAQLPVITTIDNILATILGRKTSSGSSFFARA